MDQVLSAPKIIPMNPQDHSRGLLGDFSEEQHYEQIENFYADIGEEDPSCGTE